MITACSILPTLRSALSPVQVTAAAAAASNFHSEMGAAQTAAAAAALKAAAAVSVAHTIEGGSSMHASYCYTRQRAQAPAPNQARSSSQHSAREREGGEKAHWKQQLLHEAAA